MKKKTKFFSLSCVLMLPFGYTKTVFNSNILIVCNKKKTYEKDKIIKVLKRRAHTHTIL